MVYGALPCWLMDSHVVCILLKVILDYDKDGQWVIERGSCLSFYDDRHFFLIFKHLTTGVVRMHWNLPEPVAQKLGELLELAKTHEEMQGMVSCLSCDAHNRR